MYIPSYHRIDDQGVILDLMRRHSFATLITVADGAPVATHLPILVEADGPVVLAAHMARQNQQWKSLASSEVLAIFAGPHGYVSPRWYESTPNVPTWNYVSIHARGRAEIIEDEAEALSHLERMISTFDPSLGEAQPESVDRAYLRRLVPGVVVFRVNVDRIDAKAKLNQNKAESDRQSIRSRYADSSDPDEQEMFGLMGQ